MKRIVVVLIIVVVAIFFLLTGVKMEKENIVEKDEKVKVERKKEYRLSISINDELFTATFLNNDTTKEFIKLLPMSIVMNDLNDNEKYYYLEKSLPTDEKNYKVIESGDIMLFGDNCLVIFYEGHTSYYNYTKIGKIDNVDNLMQVLKNNNNVITFKLNEE